jgi:cystathionine beta-lyase
VITRLEEALLPGHLGVLASVAAFTDGLPWLDAVRGQLDQNRWLLSRLLAEQLPQAGYVPPQASFLAWIDCRELRLDADPAEVFLDRGRVALSPGPDFGPEGQGFARLNMGTSPDLLGEAVRRMATAVRAAPV